jgi:cytochrome c5
MSTTISMVLGILFWVLAVVAVLLQAWMWGPKFWDEANHRTTAPPFWLGVHRWVGYAFVAIYLAMMWNMVPRLWSYQFELPARTVIHAVAAITLGVLLVTKLAILKFFRHFESSAMPTLGFSILLTTTILSALSIPFALRAHGIGNDVVQPANIARVERLLREAKVREGAAVTADELRHGRQVHTTKCAYCHDLRTVLVKPRTAAGWHDVVLRMLEKPAVFGDAVTEAEVPAVTAYLVAITPDLQSSAKRKGREDDARRARVASLEAARTATVAAFDEVSAKKLLEARCTECHELDELDEHGGDDAAGWAKVVREMVSEEGAEVTEGEAAQLVQLLARTRPRKE